MQRAIAVLSDIKDLSEILGSASADGIRLVPDGSGQIRLELELTRAATEQPAPVATVGGPGPAPRGFGRRTAWVKSRLTLHAIREVSVKRLDDGSPSQVSLLVCDAVAGGYVVSLTSHDGLRLTLTMGRLNGQFEDIGKPAVVV